MAGAIVKMPKSPREALIEYEKECAETARRAERAMRNCINNGSFEHFDMWKAKKEIDKVFEKTVLKTKR